MIYPNNFEQKIGFNEIRTLLLHSCLSILGEEEVERMTFTTNTEQINRWLVEIKEFRKIDESQEDFPLNHIYDVRKSLSRIKLQGTHMEESELYDLKRSLETIIDIIKFLSIGNEAADGTFKYEYPALYERAKGIQTFPTLVQQINEIIDKYGKMRDTASPTLLNIRRELSKFENTISRTLHRILQNAQRDGIVEKDAMPTLRDGRLVIPVAPSMKRKLSGIVHDESATGRTVYIEPTEVVEANNKIRELENEERREIIKILVNFAQTLRPHVQEILNSYIFLGQIDFIRAKYKLACMFNAYEPMVEKEPQIDWVSAIHPLLQRSLAKRSTTEHIEQSNKKNTIVPLDITLSKEKHILIISGPNAGGKSVCLKTVGLLQYMLQCGLSISVGERSTAGTFQHIMIDIGDEQSIENDLSTYSSHLMNMKMMMKQANQNTLILIDEFGTGTEPQIGGAIAESVLKQFWQKKAWAVITTHYQNLKHFAKNHHGVANGAMLYDRHQMQPLFQLAIGRPGSSFAIEIARKTGIPEEVIKDASDIVGQDYIQSDKYLQDIVRDKRYWEAKRQSIHNQEKELIRTKEKYEEEIAQLKKEKKDIIAKAKADAEALIKESNKRIENVIKTIREEQAEKEATKRLRQELSDFQKAFQNTDNIAKVAHSKKQKTLSKKEIQESGLLSEEALQKQIEKINSRKERHERQKQEKEARKIAAAERLREISQQKKEIEKLSVGDAVRMKGLTTIGKVESIEGKSAMVIFGGMRSKINIERLEYADNKATQIAEKQFQTNNYSRQTRETIDRHRNQFKQELDVRGLRTDEAINQVQYFIDDAILVGVNQVRILHGKGNGILRSMIRQYLNTIPNVNAFRDEHVQFGGAGITVVEL